jgi:hypothetical protein
MAESSRQNYAKGIDLMDKIEDPRDTNKAVSMLSLMYNTGFLLVIFVAVMVYHQEIVSMSMHWTETVGDKTAAHDKVFAIYENVEKLTPVKMQESLSEVTGCGGTGTPATLPVRFAASMFESPLCYCIVRSHTDYTLDIGLNGIVEYTTEQRQHNASVIIDNCFSKVRSAQSINEKYLGTLGNSINIPTVVVFWNLIAFICTFGLSVMEGTSRTFYIIFGTVMTVISLVPLLYIPNNGIQILIVVMLTVVYAGYVLILSYGLKWPFKNSMLFWPLYAVAFIVTGLLNNIYAYNRDYAFNVAYVLFGLAVAGLLCVGDYAVMMHEVSKKNTKLLTSVVRDTWRTGVFIVSSMYIVCSFVVPEVEVIDPCNTSVVLSTTGLVIALIALIQHRELPDASVIETEKISMLRRRLVLESVARTIVTVCVILDMMNMSTEDNLPHTVDPA